MTTLIFGIIIGALFVLTVENTIMIHRKPPKKEQIELTDEERRKAEEDKQDQEEWKNLMGFMGRERK